MRLLLSLFSSSFFWFSLWRGGEREILFHSSTHTPTHPSTCPSVRPSVNTASQISAPFTVSSTQSPPPRPQKKLHLSISLPRRLRTRRPTQTPLIPAPLPQPLLSRELQLALQLRRRFFPMNEIAEAAAHAAFAAIQSAAGFAEVGHGREFAVDRASGVPAAVERVAGGLR